MRTNESTINDSSALALDSELLSGSIKSHLKRCGGCPICRPYRNLLRKRIHNDEISKVSRETGVPADEIVRIRASNHEDRKISDYVKSTKDFFDERGNIDVEKYLLLKFFFFKDEEIRKHFGIEKGSFQGFKHRKFPGYNNTDSYKEIFAPKCLEAYQKWYKSGNNTIIKVK